MAEKFGLDFEVVNSETMKQVRRTHGVHANPFTLFPRIIVSMAWLPGQRAQRQLRDAFTSIDARPRSPSTSSSSTRPTTSRRAARRTDKVGRERRGYAVDSQRTVPFASSPSAPSTGSSSPRRRTTATPSPSPRCWR